MRMHAVFISNLPFLLLFERSMYPLVPPSFPPSLTLHIYLLGRTGCVQFSTHSTPTCIVKHPDGSFYISFGVSRDCSGSTM